MFDIHMHVIPEVDDGSWSLEMSCDMLHDAYMQGVRSVIATPHGSAFLNDAGRVYENFRKLKQSWEAFVASDTRFRSYMGDEPLSLYLGCEVFCSMEEIPDGEAQGEKPGDVTAGKEKAPDFLDFLQRGLVPSLNGSGYVLVEFDPMVRPSEAVMIVILLVSFGWVPVIAHAERYPNLRCDGEMDGLLEEGCLLQVNAGSLTDRYYDEAEWQWARHLLLEKKVTFLGTDAHRSTWRPPAVKDGIRYILENCEKEYAERILFQNARELLLDV
ncbi:MAG: hypothetical protein LIO80_10025 [Lachnospiraceae bacterium]|nr:hypothetical protein [Lachnospiraceae bacterium]